MKNVLVFPCGSEIGLELARSLATSAHFRLLGASSVPDHGDFAYENRLERLPYITDPAFLDALNALVERHDVEFIFPAHDDVVLALARWQDAGRLTAAAMTPPAATCAICRSKAATYDFFAGKLPLPRRFRPGEAAAKDFPLFVKPDVGQGSKGAARVDDLPALTEKLRRDPACLTLEFLPGREYTVDCFTDRHGALRYVCGRERLRIMNGISVASREVANPAFRTCAESINAGLSLRGPWFFQLRESAAGVPTLLEIAPRIGGASGFQRAKGVNLPLLALYDRMGLDIAIQENDLPGLEMDRALASSFRCPGLAYEAAYIDYDDTLIQPDGRINAGVVAFIIQCLNRKIPVALLSRHDGNLAADLRRTRLTDLFDRVIHITDGTPKSSFIREKKALLVDDSFAERMEVRRTLGIPVFDPSAVETLLEP